MRLARLSLAPAFAAALPHRPLLTSCRSTPTMSAAPPPRSLHYLSAAKAARIDAHLMSPPYSFTLDQLMELAGQSVAHVVYHTCPPPARVTIACGPGNNGGDGLVAARHLAHFGYDVAVAYPKRSARHPFPALVDQLATLGVPVSGEVAVEGADVMVDAVFGFGFKGGVREPFGQVLRAVSEAQAVLVAVDVPSGWDVDGGGRADGAVRKPDVLISLTAPKLCARGLDGVAHWVGGRFVPQRLCEELEFQVPEYPGMDGVVRVE